MDEFLLLFLVFFLDNLVKWTWQLATDLQAMHPNNIKHPSPSLDWFQDGFDDVSKTNEPRCIGGCPNQWSSSCGFCSFAWECRPLFGQQCLGGAGIAGLKDLWASDGSWGLMLLLVVFPLRWVCVWGWWWCVTFFKVVNFTYSWKGGIRSHIGTDPGRLDVVCKPRMSSQSSWEWIFCSIC